MPGVLGVLVLSTACTGPAPTPSGAPAATPENSSSASTALAQPFTTGLAKPTSTPRSGRILFNIEGNGVPSQPAYLDRTGLHLIPVTADSTLGDPVWASATQIYFDSERAGHRHIYRMNIDGSQVRQITTGDQSQDSPRPSPDRTHLVFGTYLDDGPDQGLHVSYVDGSAVHAITPAAPAGSKAGDDPASWSPDGTHVVYVHVSDPDKGLAGLWTMPSSGGPRHRLTADTTDAGYPRWSPDGQTVLFTQHNETSKASLWTVPVSGGTPKVVVTPDDGCTAMQGTWSPDGQQIVYTYSCRGWHRTDIRLADADGSHQRTLWSSPSSGTGAYGADWDNRG